jgi:hypothetical protein
MAYLPVLPAIAAVPAAVLPDPAPDGGPVYTPVTLSLESGVPARIPLDGSRTLLLAVPLGQARRWLDDDPRTIVIDTTAAGASLTPPGPPLDLDELGPRLTLLQGSVVGDTVAFVPGQPAVITIAGFAVVEVVIDSLVLSIGSLRSPGQYGSSVKLHWRDLHPAGNSGPPLTHGDGSIPRRVYLARKVVE